MLFHRRPRISESAQVRRVMNSLSPGSLEMEWLLKNIGEGDESDLDIKEGGMQRSARVGSGRGGEGAVEKSMSMAMMVSWMRNTQQRCPCAPKMHPLVRRPARGDRTRGSRSSPFASSLLPLLPRLLRLPPPTRNQDPSPPATHPYPRSNPSRSAGLMRVARYS